MLASELQGEQARGRHRCRGGQPAKRRAHDHGRRSSPAQRLHERFQGRRRLLACRQRCDRFAASAQLLQPHSQLGLGCEPNLERLPLLVPKVVVQVAAQ